MRQISILLDQNLAIRVQKDLDTNNKSYVSDKYILAIAATLHHETKDRAYLLGYSPQSEALEFTLVDTGSLILALFMEEAEMDVFENTVLSWKDGYIHLTKT